jgi:hypothetical protein
MLQIQDEKIKSDHHFKKLSDNIRERYCKMNYT